MRTFTFLVNPTSGGGAAPAAVVPVARHLRVAGASVDVTYSPGPLAMEALVEEAVSRGDVVVSVGGDGMLSSLAGLVSAAGGTLGVVPAGRGNDFARMLGLPTDPAAVAARLLEGEVRSVDLVSLTLPGAQARVVAGSVYAGVDARAGEIVDKAHRLPRRAQYPYAALRALATYSPAHFRVSVDGVERDYAAASVVVANSAFYGSGMKIAPAALVSDGVLDVVVIEAASRLALMRSLPKVYDGGHVDLPEVTLLTGKRVELGADSARPVPVGGDGEPLGRLPGLADEPAVVEVRPGALDVVC
ncbi:MAG TPA: diacylglycerol kinase family protein [Nocardioides sp.]|uniref:diacylglycerol/lipid kinase family protein n=1 Tax=Nocardioides sp. TaxID=35761 RepID=UPI002E320FAB|nr:diacylglycerol kinase family protein [Nocardioides sp.]HEX5087405.1 diacylglycerol kinase family protein [Nocardioides sp.]